MTLGHMTREGGLRGEVALLAGLYAVPAALCLLLWLELRDFPFFGRQLSDGAWFLGWAADIAAGRGFEPVPYFVNPLYLFFLAVLAKLSLGGESAARAVQVLLGCAVYPAVYLVARRLFGRPAGLAAWAAALAYGPLLLAHLEVSGAWLEALLGVLLALALTGGEATAPRLAAGGLVAGAAVLARPNLLPVVPLAPLLAAVAGAGGWRAAPWRRLLLFPLAAAAVILPVGVRNAVVGGEFVLVASHGGINFYIGNSARAGGTFYAPPGFHEDPISVNSRDSRAIASAESGRELSAGEASRYWFRQGLDWVARHPGDAAVLYAKKALLAVHAFEVPLNSDYALFREGSWLLTLLALPFPFLLITGLAGLLGRATRRPLLPVSLLVAVNAAGLVAFFISSRYRLPLAPLLAVAAGPAMADTLQLARRDRARFARRAGAVAAGTLLLSLSPPFVRTIDLDSRASSYESLGIGQFDAGHLAEAERSLRTAIAIRPAIRSPHWYLARILEGRGEREAAAAEWRRAAELYGPDSSWGSQAQRNARRLAVAPAR